MKAFLAISSLLALCLAFAPAYGAAVKSHKENAAKGSASGAQAAAPKEIPPAANESRNAEKVAPEPKKTNKPALEKPEGFHVGVHDGRLSVNVKDQRFGDVISSIANSAGFNVDLSNDVFGMKLSTRFKEVGLQRGILRLLFLVDQKNYFIHYRPDGSIKLLEVHGDMQSGQRTLTGAHTATGKTLESTPQTRTPQVTQPPASPTVIPDRNRRKRISIPPPEKSIKEPVKEKEVLEPDYMPFIPMGGQGGGDAGPSDEPSPEPTSGPTPEPAPGSAIGDCSDDPACNIIPEGPIPPLGDLLNAPIIP